MDDTVKINTRYENKDCGMCGPSALQISTIVVTKYGAPVYQEEFRQMLCDNSDPLSTDVLLRLALEGLGFTVHINEEDDW